MVGKIPSSIVVAVVFMSAFYLTLAVLPENAQAITLFVGGSGPGNYTTIQSAIDAASPKDTVFVYNGTYLENLVVGKSLSLVGENKSITVIDGGNISDVILVQAEWVNISGFKVQNSSHDWFSTPAGIQLYGSRNCNITNNTILNNYVGIMLQQSRQNTIIGNDFLMNGGGILLEQSDDNTLADNSMSDNWGGIALSSSSNSIVTSNTMVEGRFMIWGDLLEHWNTHTIDVSNTASGGPVHYWKDAVGGTIPLGAGQVILANCSNVLIENQSFNRSSVGVQLGFSTNNVIKWNTFHPNNMAGIRAVYSTENSIENNTFLNNSYGMFLLRSTNFSIVGNVISGNYVPGSQQTGIYLNHDSGFFVTGNNISGVDRGVFIQIAYEIYVSDNDIYLNNDEGLLCRICDNITVVGNDISGSVAGIEFLDTDNSLIYHNRIVNNIIQAFDDRDTNQWDNGYPTGGNFWSNYMGVDNCSGPNQDICPDSDGLGDIPHIINVNNQDRYPLMSPRWVTLPRPPVLLQANLNGSNLENVTISWSLSPDDGASQNPVAFYKVYRNSTHDSLGRGYMPVAITLNGTSQFTDISAGEADPNNYFYRICAVNLANRTGCAENQAAKFVSPLSEGRNLVSIPLILSDLSIERDLETLKYDKAWMYDSTTAKWKSYMISKPYYGELRSINHRMGVWINVTEESNLTVAGIVPSNTLIQLHTGWNLVGFPSFNISYTVGNLKAETGATRVEGFDQTVEPYYLRVLDDGDFLQPGYGYWVYVEADTAWIVENF